MVYATDFLVGIRVQPVHWRIGSALLQYCQQVAVATAAESAQVGHGIDAK